MLQGLVLDPNGRHPSLWVQVFSVSETSDHRNASAKTYQAHWSFEAKTIEDPKASAVGRSHAS